MRRKSAIEYLLSTVTPGIDHFDFCGGPFEAPPRYIKTESDWRQLGRKLTAGSKPCAKIAGGDAYGSNFGWHDAYTFDETIEVRPSTKAPDSEYIELLYSMLGTRAVCAIVKWHCENYYNYRHTVKVQALYTLDSRLDSDIRYFMSKGHKLYMRGVFDVLRKMILDDMHALSRQSAILSKCSNREITRVLMQDLGI